VKHAYQYSQSELEGLALAKDVGSFLCMDVGWINARFGPHVTMALGCLAIAVSCSCIGAAAVTGDFPYTLMLMLFWIWGHGMSACDNSGISTAITNFPRHKGTACGLMKAMEGITAAVMNTIFYTFSDKDHLEYYPMFLASTGLSFGVLLVPVMYKTNQPALESDIVIEKKFSCLTVALLCYIVFSGIIGYFKYYNYVTLATAALCLCSLFLITLPMTPVGTDDADEASAGSVRAPHTFSGVDMLVSSMLKTLDFWVLFVTCVLLVGAQIMFSNNLAQLTTSLNQDVSADSAVYVTLFSVFSAFGRVLVGFGSEVMKETVYRPWWVCVSSIASCLSCLFVLLGKDFLAPASACMGFGVGSIFALTAVVVGELFGPSQIAVKYSCIFAACLFGSVLFGSLLAPLVYDAEAHVQGTDVCLGEGCFRTTFIATALSSLLSLLTASFVALRSRCLYSRLHQSPNSVSSDAPSTSLMEVRQNYGSLQAS